MAGVHCVHYIGERTVRLGSLQGLYERFLIENLIRRDCTGEVNCLGRDLGSIPAKTGDHCIILCTRTSLGVERREPLLETERKKQSMRTLL